MKKSERTPHSLGSRRRYAPTENRKSLVLSFSDRNWIEINHPKPLLENEGKGLFMVIATWAHMCIIGKDSVVDAILN